LKERIVRLDAIRGFLLLLMTVDHYPSVIRRYTLEGAGFVSAAEGFVLLSGYVTGLSFTSYLLNFGKSQLWYRALAKARSIYICHVVLFTLLLLSLKRLEFQLSNAYVWNDVINQSLARTLIAGFLLIYKPTFLDILPLYCLLTLVAPLVIVQLDKGRYALIFALSAGFWAAAQFVGHPKFERLFASLVDAGHGNFDIWAWQLLFVVGLVYGYLRANRNKVCTQPKRGLHLALFAAAVAMFLLRHDLLPGSALVSSLPLIDRAALGPVRLLNFFLLVPLVSQPWLWPEKAWHVKWLAYLGRNSLQVYSFQVLCVFFLPGLFSVQDDSDITLWPLLMVLVACVSLFYPAYISERLKMVIARADDASRQPSCWRR